MPTMYKVKDQKGLSLKQKENQVKTQAMDLVGRIQSLQKKGIKLDMPKIETMAKIAMIVNILKEAGLIEGPELDLNYQQELNNIISVVEKQSANSGKKIVIAKGGLDIASLKAKTGVN